MVRRRQENLKWEEVIGSLTSATTVVNFEPEMDTAVSHSVQSVLSFQHNTHRIASKTKGFPNLKINTSQ